MEPQELIERAAEIQARADRARALQRRFAAVFEETDTERAHRLAQEVAIDGDLGDIPAAHRLAVARQLILILDEHGLIAYDRDDAEEHWRVVAKRLGLPYLEVMHAVLAGRLRTEAVRSDVDEWLEWAREHAPERLQVPKKGEA